MAQKARVRGADGESETRRAQIVTRDAMISSDSVTYESDSLENIVQSRSFTTKETEFLPFFFSPFSRKILEFLKRESIPILLVNENTSSV